jgi:hypothetical protein
MKNEEYNFHNQTQSEPGIIKVVKWAFSNPEKVAALGLGIAAFGLAAFFLESQRENNIMKRDSDSIAIGSSSTK